MDMHLDLAAIMQAVGVALLGAVAWWARRHLESEENRRKARDAARYLSEDDINAQLLEGGKTIGVLEIKNDGSLVAIVVNERGRISVAPGCHFAGKIAAIGGFVFNDVSPLIGKGQCCHGA